MKATIAITTSAKQNMINILGTTHQTQAPLIKRFFLGRQNEKFSLLTLWSGGGVVEELTVDRSTLDSGHHLNNEVAFFWRILCVVFGGRGGGGDNDVTDLPILSSLRNNEFRSKLLKVN